MGRKPRSKEQLEARSEKRHGWKEVSFKRFIELFPDFIETHTDGPCEYCIQNILKAWDDFHERKTHEFRPGPLDGDYYAIQDCVRPSSSGKTLFYTAK